MKICNSIGINAGDLLNQIEQQERRVLIRKEDWDDLDLHHGIYDPAFFGRSGQNQVKRPQDRHNARPGGDVANAMPADRGNKIRRQGHDPFPDEWLQNHPHPLLA